MISRLIDEKSVHELRQLLEHCSRPVITCHKGPDGDAIGSSLGLCHVLRSLGMDAMVVTPDAPPKSLMFLPGADEIVIYSYHPEFAKRLLGEADLIFCLDYQQPERVDKMAPALLAAPAPKVMIDHHEGPAQFTRVTISHPEVSSTAMLVFRVICRLELFDHIDRAAAECILCGMMTDTGNFSYNSNDPDLYVVVGEMLRKGVDKDAIYRKAMNTKTVSSMKLNGYALGEKMEIFPEHQCALISLTAEELERFHYEKGDTEGLVNQPLALPEVTWSIYLRQDPEQIKISTRSKGDFPVNKFCHETFPQGGGHLNAAGAEFFGSLQECIDLIKATMPDYDKYLPKK